MAVINRAFIVLVLFFCLCSGELFAQSGPNGGVVGPGATSPVPAGTTCPTWLQPYAPFANTTAAPTGATLNIYDGAQCVPWATLNQTAHQIKLTPDFLTINNQTRGASNATTLLAQIYFQTLTTSGGVYPGFQSVADCIGDNTHFQGCSGGVFQAEDNPSVGPGTKGVLYGLQVVIKPLQTRNNSPADDAAGVIVQNATPGTAKATEAIGVTANSNFAANAHEWGIDFDAGTSADIAFAAGGSGMDYNYGLDLVYGGTNGTFGNAGIRIPGNNIPGIVARNAANAADVEVARLDGSNYLNFDNGGNGSRFSGSLGVTGNLNADTTAGIYLYYASNTGYIAAVQQGSGYKTLALNSSPLNLNVATNGAITTGTGTFTGPDSGTWSSTGFSGTTINNSIIGGTTPAAITGTTIRANTSFNANGSAGISTTCTVTAGNSYIFTFGILTSKGANCT